MYLRGILHGVFIFALLLILGFYAGFITFINRLPNLSSYINFIYNALGSSVIFFLLDLWLYAISLILLKKYLKESDFVQAGYWQKINDLSVSVFFGIGVIYTAIGMQGALTESLAGLDEETAKGLGPWGVLRRMVDGGLILALMTTIVGGIGGYAMRFVRQFYLGRLLEKIRQEGLSKYEKKVIALLEEIRDAHKENTQSIDLK